MSMSNFKTTKRSRSTPVSMASQTQPVQPWDQRPEYLDACRQDFLPGEPTTNVVPFPAGADARDVTDPHPGHTRWHLMNLPDILYVLTICPQPDEEENIRPCNHEHCASWRAFKFSPKPAAKRDSNNQITREHEPQPGKPARILRDYKILPDRISTTVPPWYVEVLRRLDPRMSVDDIVMRMNNVGQRRSSGESKFKNKRINNDNNRTWKPKFTMQDWFGQGGSSKTDNNQTKKDIQDKVGETALRNNSTRGFTPGLIDPNRGDVPGNRVPLPQKWQAIHDALVAQGRAAPVAGSNVHTSGPHFPVLDVVHDIEPRPKRRQRKPKTSSMPADESLSQYDPAAGVHQQPSLETQNPQPRVVLPTTRPAKKAFPHIGSSVFDESDPRDKVIRETGPQPADTANERRPSSSNALPSQPSESSEVGRKRKRTPAHDVSLENCVNDEVALYPLPPKRRRVGTMATLLPPSRYAEGTSTTWLLQDELVRRAEQEIADMTNNRPPRSSNALVNSQNHNEDQVDSGKKRKRSRTDDTSSVVLGNDEEGYAYIPSSERQRVETMATLSTPNFSIDDSLSQTAHRDLPAAAPASTPQPPNIQGAIFSNLPTANLPDLELQSSELDTVDPNQFGPYTYLPSPPQELPDLEQQHYQVDAGCVYDALGQPLDPLNHGLPSPIEDGFTEFQEIAKRSILRTTKGSTRVQKPKQHSHGKAGGQSALGSSTSRQGQFDDELMRARLEEYLAAEQQREELERQQEVQRRNAEVVVQEEEERLRLSCQRGTDAISQRPSEAISAPATGPSMTPWQYQKMTTTLGDETAKKAQRIFQTRQ